jgi:hypothetical protein
MRRLSSICTVLFYANDLIKPHGSVRIVRMWCGMHTNPVLWCFDNPDGLSCEDFLVDVVPELANGLRPDTVVLSQDPSGA